MGARSILLIEDNPGDVLLVREALEEHNIEGELLVIADGADAIHYIEAFDTQLAACPDLVILDLNLPRQSGREVLRLIRHSEKLRGVTVVILSSSDAQRDRADAMRLGANRYLRKPLLLDEFLRLGAVFREIVETAGNQGG